MQQVHNVFSKAAAYLEPGCDLGYQPVHKLLVLRLVYGDVWPCRGALFCIHLGQVPVPVRSPQQGHALVDELVEVKALVCQEL